MYYYKLRNKSELGKTFRRMWNRCIKAERQADNFARKAGAKEFYPLEMAFAGGVAAVIFEGDVCPKPKLWTEAGKDGDGRKLWVPRQYKAEEIPTDPNHPHRRLPLYVREAMRIEKARRALPVVKTETILTLLKADPTFGKADDGKMHLVRLVTPTFFAYWNHIYIGIAYPCQAEELEEIMQADYIEAEKAVRELARVSAVEN